jgi:hypothetical protein
LSEEALVGQVVSVDCGVCFAGWESDHLDCGSCWIVFIWICQKSCKVKGIFGLSKLVSQKYKHDINITITMLALTGTSSKLRWKSGHFDIPKGGFILVKFKACELK